MRSAVERVVLYWFFLSGFGFGVRGFSLNNCYLDGGSAICSQHKLLQVPTDIPPTVKSLDLSKNNISQIQAGDFKLFQNLTRLNLKQNFISHIGKHTFSHLISLERLVLSGNRIRKLEDDVFDGLSKLTELLLGSNPIRMLEPDAFRALSGLTLLELSDNELRTVAQVHSATRHTPHLHKLIISNIGITTFRSQDLTNTSTEIMFLDVSENPLEEFEVSADVFPNLTGLYMDMWSHTVKSDLSWSVQNHSLLRHVTTLDVSAVQLPSVDEWTKLFSTFNSSVTALNLGHIRFRPNVLINLSCSLSKLSKLQIQHNSLIIGPNLFQMCRKVTSLDLQDNGIKRIGDGSFDALHRLQTLVLSQNKLQKVPFATRNLMSLQELDLSFNHIKTIGCQDFTGLKNLKKLSLQQNKITALSNCSFHRLSLLQVLNLQGNLIGELGSIFQSYFPNLKSLVLDQNKLTIIPRGAFRALRSLRSLSLSQNQIDTLQRGCFSGLTNLMTLQLGKNNIKRTALNSPVFGDLLNLRSLDLQNNQFKSWDSSSLQGPSFINLSRLESLKISGRSSAGRRVLASNFLQGLTNLLSFSCNKFELSNFSHNFFSYTPRLQSLDLSSNNLFDVSPELFAPIPHLKSLKIGETNLVSLDFLINANLTMLTFLKAPKNVFSVISEDVIRSVPSLLEFDLKQNSFTCDCENAGLVKWIINNNQTQVRDAHSFKCNHPPERKGSNLLELNVQSCLVDVGFICFVSSSCLNVLILLVSFVFHFSRFQLIYAYYIFLAWMFDSKNRKKRAACHFDAFVSYNTRDEAWVFEELVPRLEQEQGWRLCLHHRDFLPGKPIVENMADAIYGSRKTICVISRRYLQSEWCSKEMQLASFRLFDEREDVLILLFLEDIPSSHLSPFYRMKKLLKSRSYLSWPRAAQNPQLFWEKLRQALRTNTAADDRLRLTVNQTPRH